MSDRWSPGPVYAFTCGRGLRLIASDAVEPERLKRQQADFHTGEASR